MGATPELCFGASVVGRGIMSGKSEKELKLEEAELDEARE